MSSPGDPESPPRDVPTPDPDTEDVATSPGGADDDVESDPGKGADDRADWTDEGGATGEGPAT
ncbi:hypothetical protein OG921_19910 [Aldersonia sp. NBC_00410]|uniref:hypothetical protein n=1 Tax=Aldersonia sp. NBC_00410 TaxID=2975954 RepID=UPI002252AF62|nr:hypothetical protein [Aldersonia sp. NBC_00410]MCX5045438.1 hypothetical protein [Aldersonia sp. NBC_00410]